MFHRSKKIQAPEYIRRARVILVTRYLAHHGFMSGCPTRYIREITDDAAAAVMAGESGSRAIREGMDRLEYLADHEGWLA